MTYKGISLQNWQPGCIFFTKLRQQDAAVCTIYTQAHGLLGIVTAALHSSTVLEYESYIHVM